MHLVIIWPRWEHTGLKLPIVGAIFHYHEDYWPYLTER